MEQQEGFLFSMCLPESSFFTIGPSMLTGQRLCVTAFCPVVHARRCSQGNTLRTIEPVAKPFSTRSAFGKHRSCRVSTCALGATPLETRDFQGPDALLFDCDGVLVDTEAEGHRIAFNKAFKEKGESYSFVSVFTLPTNSCKLRATL